MGETKPVEASGARPLDRVGKSMVKNPPDGDTDAQLAAKHRLRRALETHSLRSAIRMSSPGGTRFDPSGGERLIPVHSLNLRLLPLRIDIRQSPFTFFYGLDFSPSGQAPQFAGYESSIEPLSRVNSP